MCWLAIATLVQSFPKCGSWISVALLWVLLVSLPWRRNLNSGRWESVLQSRRRGEDGVCLLRGQFYLILNYWFSFLQYLHNRIDFFPALSLTDSLSNRRVLSPGYRKPGAPGDLTMAVQRKQRHSQNQTGSASGAAISFYYYFSLVSQHLSLPLSFDPVLLSCQLSLWLFYFFSDHSYFNSNYFSLLSSMLSQAHQEHALPFASILLWSFPKLITQFSVSALLFHLIHSSLLCHFPCYFPPTSFFPPRLHSLPLHPQFIISLLPLPTHSLFHLSHIFIQLFIHSPTLQLLEEHIL